MDRGDDADGAGEGRYPQRSEEDVRRRAVGRATSADFRNWTKPEVLLSAAAYDPPSVLYYNAGHTWLPGGHHQQVMFVNYWKQADDTMDLRLFSTAGALA